MSDDLLSILTGGKEKLARDPVDYVVRTVYGEADPDTASRQAVAGVIVNRAKKKGKGYDEIVLEPGQFEPWGDAKARARMEALDPASEEYQAIARDVAPVLSGEVTVPYDHFYAPEVLKGRGQSTPDWDDGTGTKVGTQLFFALGDGGPGPNLGAMLGTADQKAADEAWASFTSGGKPDGNLLDASETKIVDGKVFVGDTGKPLTPEQQETYLAMANGQVLNPDAPAGSVNRPWVRRGAVEGSGHIESFKPGEYYIDLDGVLKQEPGPNVPTIGFGQAMGRGGLDVLHSIADLAPFAGDSELRARLEANRLIYDAAEHGLSAKAGRFGGQVLGAAPIMAAGAPVLGVARTALPAAAPALDFIGGQAGGNLLMRGASMGTAGALEGAGAATLVHSANDAPLANQIALGSAFGSVGRPVLAGLGHVGNRMFNPQAIGGAEPAAQRLVYTQAQDLPVPVPLTQGQITLAPAQQMSENALMRGVKGDAAAQVMRDFAAEQQGALRGNVDAITGRITGGSSVEAGEGGAAVSKALNQKYDAAKTAIDEAYTKARAAADGAYLPAEERSVMAATIREATREIDLSGTPRVKSILDGLDESPTSSTFTPLDIFDARAKLTTLRASSDGPEALAASRSVKAIDAYIDDALTRDLISGDEGVVQAWRDAIGKRREFGKLFEGDDLINGLTERTLHGDGRALKVAPEDAANYIFNRSNLGFIGKRDLARDLTRLRTVLGPDSAEWGALRGEALMRFARAGEGAPEGGVAQFSGQKFLKAWNDAKSKDPQIIRTLFTAEERELIDQFAEVAQRATTPVKGGDNASNSGVYVAALTRKFFENMGTMGGGAVGSVGGPGGAAVGAGIGRAFDTFMRDVRAVVQARKATAGAKPAAPPTPKNKLIGALVDSATHAAPVIAGNNLVHAGP